MESHTHTSFAELITQLALIRENNGLTIEEAARRMGVDKAAISRLERGLTNPTVRTLCRYAEAINADLALFAIPKTNSDDVVRNNAALMRELTLLLEKEAEVPHLRFE